MHFVPTTSMIETDYTTCPPRLQLASLTHDIATVHPDRTGRNLPTCTVQGMHWLAARPAPARALTAISTRANTFISVRRGAN